MAEIYFSGAFETRDQIQEVVPVNWKFTPYQLHPKNEDDIVILQVPIEASERLEETLRKIKWRTERIILIACEETLEENTKVAHEKGYKCYRWDVPQDLAELIAYVKKETEASS